MLSIEHRIAQDIAAKPEQVRAAVELLDGGATVPFISRYRKEVTGGLDDTQLRLLEERLHYLRELEDRRATILASVEEQGKLTDTLKNDLLAADSKARLEDLYLPYKPKRRTKAQIAREAGLEPLAIGLREDPTQTPETFAEAFVDAEKGVADVRSALDGARAILMESIAEDAYLVGELRDWMWGKGQIRAKVVAGKENEGAKFRDYFDHVEPIGKIPSHRLLALMRARNEGVIELELSPDVDSEQGHIEGEGRVAARADIHNRGRAADAWLRETVRLTWRVKLHLHLTLDLFGRVREGAEDEAIRVFGDNLKDLMLAAPAGARTVMGLDPGIRTGVKVAVVDATGKLVATDVIYPHEPRKQWNESIAQLAKLGKKHGVDLIAIGNGTASRETDKLAGELIKKHADLNMAKVVVSEAGASVYSASEIAAKEFPELDVTLRGAVSIARRLQDPLAELVKIEPKAIGVGQYQHDVNQIKLARALETRVEDCVNAVGVDVNTASAALLSRVAGLSAAVAENVVKHRDANGPFANRKALLKVPRLGDKAFEQCAGFLRGLKPEQFTDERFGVPTVRDILKELEKPGRDPRPEFVAPSFAEGVEDVKDLKPGMILEGRVTNVAAFGAFVDIGVHQDGLVHVSALSHTFVKDPRDAVKAGDIVKVKVMEVDLPRQRIGLSMRLDDEPGQSRARAGSNNDARTARDAKSGNAKSGASRPSSYAGGSVAKPAAAPASGAFADAFAKARKN